VGIVHQAISRAPIIARLAHSTNTSVASWLNMQTNLDVWRTKQTPKKILKAIEPIYALEAVEARV
jgi:plasmid maintenance system antidote protein VapI